ncbi:MAG: hypothetical protein MI802_29305 [Desulfobacterales bacterium]|nr:hypothetical protein [Desulfobacterales bacterium]
MGDNKAVRAFCTLYAVKEPEVTASMATAPLEVTWRMRFRYADGPRDCEALAVDEPNQKIYLLSKRETYPTLYELPLSFTPEDRMYTATPVAKIRTIPQPTPADLKEKYGKYRSQPTSMDIYADGTALMILTYKNGYLFRRGPNQTWAEVFKSTPETISLPLPNTGELIQREALCVDHDTKSIIVTTEQLPAPIYTLMPQNIP